MTPRARSLLLSALVVVALGACSGDDEPEATGGEGTTTTSAEAGDVPAGTIVAEDFSLTDLTVGPGDEIVLENRGAAPHTATADGGEFDLGEVPAGETSAADTAPEEPGEYPFHCEIHGTMTAILTVTG
jgi:plastocyanin